MARRQALLVPVAILAATGCAGDLPPAFRVDKLRVLAVRAEPPEVAPGNASTLDALLALPPARPGDDGGSPAISRLWLACRQLPSASALVACGTGGSNGAGGLLPDDLRPDGTGPGLLHCNNDPEARLCALGVAPLYLAARSERAARAQRALRRARKAAP